MRSMNEEDAVYAALLIQLLSDSDTNVLDDRIHSWIEHQYDFVFSENVVDNNQTLYAPDSRSPSPSPSSSVGAHRGFDLEHGGVSTRLSSLYTEPSSSYDNTWLSATSPTYTLIEEEENGEQGHPYALGFTMQESTPWKLRSPPTSYKILDKDLPPRPPSPASSLKRPAPSRMQRSRSSSGRMTMLPSLTSTLSPDRTQTHDAHPPLPTTVAHALASGESRKRSGSLPRKFLRLQEDKDSLYPSPTVSDFSLAYSRETPLTTPCASTSASPIYPTFVSAPCSPENIALPASPLGEQRFFAEHTPRVRKQRSRSSPTSPVLPKASIPSSSSTTCLVSNAIDACPASFPPPSSNANTTHEVTRHHRTECSQSQWSVTTESSDKALPSEPKATPSSTPRTPAKEEKHKEPTTPKSRGRLFGLISRLSPGRNSTSASTNGKMDQQQTALDDAEHHTEQAAEKRAFGKRSSKKASLASIRTSFSLSRTSFSSHRPSTSKEGPSLPTSPIQTSHSASRPSLTDVFATPLSKKSSLASLRASFSLSRTSFSSIRSPTEDIPPLPTSPGATKTSFNVSRPSLADGTTPALHKKSSLTSLNASAALARASPLPTSPMRSSFSATRPSFTDGSATSEVIPPLPKVALPKSPPRVAQIDAALPPFPSSLSKMNSPSQVSFSETVTTSASTSRASLVTSHSAPGTSSMPPPSKRVSLASAAGIHRSVSASSILPCETPMPAKPILRLTAKPSGPRLPTLSAPRSERKVSPSRFLVSNSIDLSSSASSGSRIPQAPTKFIPPAKLASVLEARSERLAPAISSSFSVSALPARPSKLPTPLRYMPKGQVTPPAVTVENALPGRPPKLPTPTLEGDLRVEALRRLRPR